MASRRDYQRARRLYTNDHLPKEPTPNPNVKEYRCSDCGIKIVVEGKDFIPAEPILCQRCDPAYDCLADNKYHRG